jgi:hypothetical protein
VGEVGLPRKIALAKADGLDLVVLWRSMVGGWRVQTCEDRGRVMLDKINQKIVDPRRR